MVTGPSDPMVVETLKALSEACYKTGEKEEGMQHMKRAQELQRKSDNISQPEKIGKIARAQKKLAVLGRLLGKAALGNKSVAGAEEDATEAATALSPPDEQSTTTDQVDGGRAASVTGAGKEAAAEAAALSPLDKSTSPEQVEGEDASVGDMNEKTDPQ